MLSLTLCNSYTRKEEERKKRKKRKRIIPKRSISLLALCLSVCLRLNLAGYCTLVGKCIVSIVSIVKKYRIVKISWSTSIVVLWWECVEVWEEYSMRIIHVPVERRFHSPVFLTVVEVTRLAQIPFNDKYNNGCLSLPRWTKLHITRIEFRVL